MFILNFWSTVQYYTYVRTNRIYFFEKKKIEKKSNIYCWNRYIYITSHAVTRWKHFYCYWITYTDLVSNYIEAETSIRTLWGLSNNMKYTYGHEVWKLSHVIKNCSIVANMRHFLFQRTNTFANTINRNYFLFKILTR